MKKLLKFIVGTAGAAAAGFGAYCAYKKFVAKDTEDDDFDDDIDDFDLDEDEDESSPEYVSLNANTEDAAEKVADALDDAQEEIKEVADDISENVKDAFS